MKAVYQSEKKYFQIAKESVLTRETAYSEPGEFYSEDGTKVTVKRAIVGEKATLSAHTTSFVFREGKNHNQLTLTDPAEITAMRSFIKTRPYITEVSFEDDEE